MAAMLSRSAVRFARRSEPSYRALSGQTQTQGRLVQTHACSSYSLAYLMLTRQCSLMCVGPCIIVITEE